eukprot:2342820-Pleurochrysis_carterae.AAC.2
MQIRAHACTHTSARKVRRASSLTEAHHAQRVPVRSVAPAGETDWSRDKQTVRQRGREYEGNGGRDEGRQTLTGSTAMEEEGERAERRRERGAGRAVRGIEKGGQMELEMEGGKWSSKWRTEAEGGGRKKRRWGGLLSGGRNGGKRHAARQGRS